jgi:glycosyltransferase involved in cell wall biosynthesis
MAIPLLSKGNTVHLICGGKPGYFEYYDSFHLAPGVNHYIEAIKSLAGKVDVFHAHNEPNWFVTAVKENCEIPVVLDVHDSWLARMSVEEELKLRDEGKKAFRVYAEERNNMQLADALVFPSRPFADQIINEFGLTQPNIVLPSYLPAQFYRYTCKEWLGGLTYEGRVDVPETVENARFHGFRYCEYSELAQKLHEKGADFHLYTLRNDDKFQEIYKDISFMHEGRDYENLLSALTRHDWGLIGNIFSTPEWEVAFPNKLFEYIAACVPIVAINAQHCAEFVEEHKIGIAVESVEELCDRWSEHRQCRINLIKKRQMWTMENHIGKLEDLYKSLTKEAGN